MWVTVLISLFLTLLYLVICLVWLILGAIVSPTVFLPYATAAATFITVLSTKFKEANKIVNEGFKTVYDYVIKEADQQINGMLKKMDLQNTVKSMVNSDALKNLAQ
jgi:membrane-anchored protein YejM (alkaline phosphatase superfamily)